MKCSYSVVIWIAIVAICVENGEANDFSSFLSANASLAVVVDHEYMQQRGVNILGSFQKILGDIIRENLKNGGINVKYFTWNQVRLKKDFLAAMTVTDCKNTWKFYDATQITSILLIAITDADCPRLPLDRALMVPLVEHTEVFSQMILDLKVQQILKWKTAVVLMDQSLANENPLLVESIMHENSKNHITPISLTLHHINDTMRGQKKRAAIKKILERFKHNNDETPHQFIVLSIFYEDIIEAAGSLELFHIYNQWLFFILEETQREFDILTVTQNLKEGVNIAFALNETVPSCVEAINCTMSEISMAFVTSISRMIFEEQSIYGEISDEEWESIRFTKREKQDEILHYMKDFLRSNSKCATCSRWRIETAITWGKDKEHKRYRPGINRDTSNQNFVFINIGYWSPLLGFVTNEFVFPHIEHNFRNITMDIVTLHNPPWQILTKNSKGEIIAHSGIVMEIVKELSNILNFTYQLHEVKMLEDYETVTNSNETDDLLGSLTYLLPYQVVELIEHNQFFMAAVATTIDEPHRKPFNFTAPISVQKYSFISRKPDELSRIYLFTAPFTLETWACLLAALLITAPMLYIINRLVPIYQLKIEGLCTVKSCFWYIYGALLQQGGIYLPKADSGRLLIGVWWIVVIVLVTTYCGNLVAFLTFPKFQPSLDYMFHVFKQGEIEHFGLRNGTYFEKYATSTTTRNELRYYLNRAIIYNNAQSENIEAVKRGKRVNIDWRINLQLIIQNHFEKDKECQFSLSKESFLDEQIGLIMPANSPYLSLVNNHIQRMFQMGFIERWHQMNLPSMDKCSGKGIYRQITNHKVNLDDMQGCFLVLLLGFIFALFVVTFEVWYFRCYVMDKEQQQTAFSS